MYSQLLRRQSRTLLTLLCLTASAVVQAQSEQPAQSLFQPAQRLSLFEDVEGSAAANASQEPVRVTGPVDTTVPFVLIGTSQIGDKHRARLRNAAGETITVELDPSGSTSVPGYPGFQINRVNGREVSLQHPASSPCVGSSVQGVSCTASHQARLQLATAAPVVRQEAAPAVNEGNGSRRRGGNNNATESVDEGVPAENPFAAALRAARERGENVDPAVMRAEGARFRPRRIDPADVPPGAQLIRTPFGDRIVVE